MWVTNRFDGTISRIDPDSGEVVEEIPVGLDPRGIAVGFGSVWVALAGSNQVVRIDPETNDGDAADRRGQRAGVAGRERGRRVGREHPRRHRLARSTPTRTRSWTRSGSETARRGSRSCKGPCGWRTKRTGRSRGSSPVRRPPGAMVIGSVPQGLAGVNGDLWVSVRGTATSHRGGTLRLVSLEPPSSLDPAAAYDVISWRVLHLLGDGLVAFEPIGGTNATLVPDLATSIPTPTDGGRTYTFELRPGIRYSNGEVVAPGDFRRAIERGFRLYPGRPSRTSTAGSSGARPARTSLERVTSPKAS